ncbi:hypothetical protein ACE6H2_026384 [Prunus campanulata]
MSTCIISPNIFFIIISISSICSNSTIFSVYLSKCIVMWKRLSIQITCILFFHICKEIHSDTTNMVNYDKIINFFIHGHVFLCNES